ncbi:MULTISPECIES: hypothetical protein [Aeromicrobium]|uniref:hypothetical protein n=1 Tax=Aeromicrobium TaxID=2040 RepID=UPI0025794CAF|nr:MULTISPECIES: hypothetical protein [Aeromicrobium]
MSGVPDLALLSLTLTVGVVWMILMLLTVRNVVALRRRSLEGRSQAAAQVTHLLEEQRSRMRHLVAVIGRDDLHSALVQAEADRDRVTYSPEARADMAQHNITAEHIEAVIAYPSKRRRSPKDFAIELFRDIGSRTLLVVVADPAPGFGPPYVKSVAWQEPSRLGRLTRGVGRSLRLHRSRSID